MRERHGHMLFSDDGSTIDEQVAELLRGPPARTVAVAESCTGGLMAARLTDRAGSSEYALGGVGVYSDAAKRDLVGVPAVLIERHGAVSPEVAAALADGRDRALRRGRRNRHHRDRRSRRGHRGQAGGAGCASASPSATERGSSARCRLPGSRQDIRDRSTTVTMHLLRRLLRGEDGGLEPDPAAERARA